MRKSEKKNIIKAAAVLAVLLLIIGAAYLIRGRHKTDTAPVRQETAVNKNEKEDYNAPAEIEPIALPDDLEAVVGFKPHQLNMLTSHYALASYDIGQDSVVYHYQTAAATSGERFTVICTKLSEEDYFASVPTKNVKKESYNGIELTYAERWLYSVPNDFKMIEPIQKGIDEGTMEIEYGNSIEEVISKNCFYWYQDGIKYEIQVRNQNLPYETLYEIAKSIIDEKK